MAQPVVPSTQCGLQSSTANMQASAMITATNPTASALIKNVKVVICQISYPIKSFRTLLWSVSSVQACKKVVKPQLWCTNQADL